MKRIFCLMSLSLSLLLFPHHVIAESNALALSEVINEALENNPEVHAATSTISQTESDLITARTWQNPEISLGPGLKHIPGSDGEDDERIFKGNLELTQLIEFPGKRSLRIALAEKDREVSQVASEGLKHQIRFKVEKAFYNLLAARELHALRSEQLQSAQVFAEAARKREKSGFGSDLEVLKGEAELISAQKLLADTEAMTVGAKAALNALMGRDVNEPLEISGSLQSPLLPIALKEVLKYAIAHNPTLHAEELRVKRARLGVESTELESAPDFTVGPFVEHSSDEQVYGFGVSFPLPFWDQKSGAIQSAKSEESRSTAELRRVRLEISEFLYLATVDGFKSAKRKIHPDKRRGKTEAKSFSRVALNPKIAVDIPIHSE